MSHNVRKRKRDDSPVRSPAYDPLSGISSDVASPSRRTFGTPDTTSTLESSLHYPRTKSNDAAEGTYTYQHLQPNTLRLLTIHPGKSPHIECSLDTYSVDDLPQYEALSYVWGDPEPSFPIRVRDSHTGYATLRVGENLKCALKELKKRDSGPRRYWIDALCINQNNLEERSSQVQLMSKIFSEACNVIVWLGAADVTIAAVKSLIRKIGDLQTYEHVVETETTCQEWDAFTQFMRRPWFSRRWVIQELALAKTAGILCGEHSIPWTEFAEAVTLFEELQPRVMKKFSGSKQYDEDPDFPGEIGATDAKTLVDATNLLFRRSYDGKIIKQLSLEELVCNLSSFEVSKPHDTIYALLSLAKDVRGFGLGAAPDARQHLSPHLLDALDEMEALGALTPDDRMRAVEALERRHVQGFQVDYKKSLTEVYQDFMQFVFKSSRSLDILCRPWAPQQTSGMLPGWIPSWIRTVEAAPYGRRGPDGRLSRKNADPLVGQPGKSLYTASGTYPPTWHFGLNGQERSLLVDGFVLDVVGDVEDPARCGVIPREWLTLCGWEDSNQNPPECFWRTMIADRHKTAAPAPSIFSSSCRLMFQQRVQNGDLDLHRVRDTTQNNHLKSYADRVSQVVYNRRLTITKREQLPALTPRETQVGDLICILPGCSVPVVIRPQAEERTSKRPRLDAAHPTQEHKPPPIRCTIVGDCFVYNMMDGEAFSVKEMRDTPWSVFEIY